MKRALLKQIGNEWRDNVWLVIELSIVAVVIWLLVLLMIGNLFAWFQPMGIADDYDNVYITVVKGVEKESPEYVDLGEESKNVYFQDLRQLIAQLRDKPYIEAVGVSNNGLPFNYNYYGNGFRKFGSEDSISYYANVRYMSGEMVKVLGLESLEGLSTEHLAEILDRKELLLSDNPNYEMQGRNPADLVGEKLEAVYDNTEQPRVGALIKCIRRSEFEPLYAGNIIIPIDENNNESLNVATHVVIRVKPGMGRALEEDLRTDYNLGRIRNTRLTELHTLEEERYVCQYVNVVQLRLYSAAVIFMLFIIFLGLLGTFWFRVQQRTGEIALRKVAGATSGDIMRRLIGEVMLLFSIAAIIASIIIIILVKTSVVNIVINQSDWIKYLLIPPVGTLVIISVAIMLGIWFPATKAMRVQPAIALKEE